MLCTLLIHRKKIQLLSVATATNRQLHTQNSDDIFFALCRVIHWCSSFFAESGRTPNQKLHSFPTNSNVAPTTKPNKSHPFQSKSPMLRTLHAIQYNFTFSPCERVNQSVGLIWVKAIYILPKKLKSSLRKQKCLFESAQNEELQRATK